MRPEATRRAYTYEAVSRPATEFTGDFYFTQQVGDALWFALGDFAGHGLRAAIFMAIIQEELERIIRACDSNDPAEVVASLDEVLREVIPSNRFASLVLGRALAGGSIELVNAGHCFPLLSRSNGELLTLGTSGPVVGLAPAPCWRPLRVMLAPGDRLILYTDGVIEAGEARGEELGLERLTQIVREASPASLLDEVLDEVRRVSGGIQADDVTLFLLSR